MNLELAQGPLTSWANEPQLKQLKADFDAAKPEHDAQMAKIKQWNDLLKIQGKAKPARVNGRSSVQPKLIRRQAEWRYSALTEPLLSNDKIFEVQPNTFEDKAAADQNSLILNWQFRTKLNRRKLIDDVVRATVDEGTGILRLGWERQVVMVDKTVPVYSYYPIKTEEEFNILQQAMEAQQADIRGFNETADPLLKAAVDYYKETGQPAFAEQVGEETVKVEKWLVNRPLVEVLTPDNFYIDSSCQGDISKAHFAIVSFETCKADLLKDKGRYKGLNQVDWEGASPVNQSDHVTNTPSNYTVSDPLRKRVVAFEYWGFWDINGTGVLEPIVATWIGNTLIRMEKNPFPDGKLPFVVIPYLPIKRELYGETDAELLEDNQAIMGALTRGIIDLMGRSANSQKGYAKGMLDPLNKRKYENGSDYEFNPSQNPNQNLIEHKYPEIPNSALLMLNIQNQEAESLSGVKSFSGGISGESYGDVAAGVRGAMDASSKREMAILRRLAQGLVELGMKLISMNAVFLAEEEVIRVTNREFVKILREDLQGNFDLLVDISTAEVEDARAKDLAFMLQTLGPNSAPELVFMILAEICELKRMPELAERLRTFKPEVSPEQQRMQEIAIEKAELELEELRSLVELNRARARKEMAQSDQADLDFVEQETGTKHVRDMQKQQGQARGNQELEITKAFTKPRKPGETIPDIATAIGYSQLSNQLGNN